MTVASLYTSENTCYIIGYSFTLVFFIDGLSMDVVYMETLIVIHFLAQNNLKKAKGHVGRGPSLRFAL